MPAILLVVLLASSSVYGCEHSTTSLVACSHVIEPLHIIKHCDPARSLSLSFGSFFSFHPPFLPRRENASALVYVLGQLRGRPPQSRLRSHRHTLPAPAEQLLAYTADLTLLLHSPSLWEGRESLPPLPFGGTQLFFS